MKILLSILALIAVCGPARAGILWTWTNAGTGLEQGTFITDGELEDDAAAAGTYTVVDFAVTATTCPLPLGSVSGGDYDIAQPEIGFDWNGSAPTVFWRSSGGLTNGFELLVNNAVPDDPNRLSFGVGWFVIEEYYGTSYVHESQTAIITPVTTVTDNVSGSFGAVKNLFR